MAKTSKKKLEEVDLSAGYLKKFGSIIRRLFVENVANRKAEYISAIMFMMIGGAATAGFAAIIRYLVDSIFVDFNTAIITTMCVAIIGLSLVKGTAIYFQTLITSRIQKSIVGDLQRRQFESLILSDAVMDTSRSAAKIVAQILGRSRAAAFVVMTVSRNVFRELFTLVALAVVMVIQDPLMSVIVACAAPLLILGIAYLSRKIRNLARNELQMEGAVHALGSEALNGIRTVKVFHLEEKIIQAFSQAVERMEKRNLRLQKITALASPLMETIGGVVIGLFVIYASWQATAYGKTPGQFMAFVTAFLLAYEPAKKLASVNLQLQRKMYKVETLFDELDTSAAAAAECPQTEIGKVFGKIRFEKVDFSHGNNRPTLNRVSFDIAPGERIGIVGRSGAGKTTIVNLILAILAPDKGKIEIDDKDITKFNPASLRRNISLVTQEVFLFEGTIFDNIADGRSNANREDIIDAARRASVTNFADKLPNGLDTAIGANGARLSGGERQRVAIARALLKNAPILIYDEATSALDGETERDVMHSVLPGKYQPTTLFVTHRLSTLQSVDRAIVIDNGCIVDSGTLTELTSRSELFRSLFNFDGKESVEPAA